MKKYFLKGKTFYTLFVMFASLILALVCSAYMNCYFALKNASSQLEASLETILTLQVQSIGESYSSDEYSALEAELSENAILTELASRDRIDQDEDMEQAEDLLRNYKESISYADLICYFYFENSGYLMCTMLSGADASDLAPDYVTERLVLEAMASETEDGEENERKQFEKIRQYVQDHFRDPNLSAGMVAERFQISPSGLSRKFKKYYQDRVSGVSSPTAGD